MRRSWVHTLGFVALLCGSGLAQETERATFAVDGTQLDNGSYNPAISSDGRYVAFYGDATNLVWNDFNARRDAFVHDRLAGTTRRVSVSTGGTEGNDWTSVNLGPLAISSDGRYVVFDSDATNLVAGDTNGVTDIFVRDQVAGTTQRVNTGAGGVQANGPSRVFFSSISTDGRYVVFSSRATNLVAGDTNGVEDVFVRDCQSGTTERVSVGAGGAQSNQVSHSGTITPDGAYVAFYSEAANLVANDTNGFADVFVRDRAGATTERVSLATGGTQGDFVSLEPSISSDGRFVAFYSGAANLVPGDTNGTYDVFLRDRQSGATERVSVATGGTQGDSASVYPSISADSRFVAFYSAATNLVAGDTNAAADVFVHDRLMDTTERVDVDSSGSQPDGGAGIASISGDGRYVAFASYATNLVPDDDTHGYSDIFVRDRLHVVRTTEMVSVDSSGVQGNSVSLWGSISGDGRYVAFRSGSRLANDPGSFYDIFVRDLQSGTTECASVDSSESGANGDSTSSFISADGRYVAFNSLASNLVTGDTNGFSDVFVRDRQGGTTERVSVSTGGAQGNAACDDFPSTSSDGRFVAFRSEASNLVPEGDTNGIADIFVRDRQNGTTERVNVATGGAQANAENGDPSISADGRFVAFQSDASNLVAGDTNGVTDVFVRDRQNGTTERVSVANGSGAQGNGESSSWHWSSISGDGRFVAFTSFASNLIAGDTSPGVFVRDRQSGTTERASVDSTGEIKGFGNFASISTDGRYVAFQSFGTILVPDDRNNSNDIFVRDRRRRTTERVSVDSAGVEGNTDSWEPAISADGHFVAFTADASNLDPADANVLLDVFVHESLTPAFTSLCEPGVGGVIVCPCSNPPAGAGRGCNNSAGTGGARLTATGFPRLAADTLVFTTSGEKPTALSVVLQGSVFVASGAPYGQGVRCAGGALKRLFTKSAAGGSITAPDFGIGDPTVSARSAASGSLIQSGQSRLYLVYYRDPVVLGGCPAGSTFNATQTGLVDWSL
jgi:Tol biopolymer transport system component